MSNVLKFKNDNQFHDGYRHGDRMIAVMYGTLTAENDPEVAQAFKAASQLQKSVEPGASERFLAAWHLHIIYF